MKVNKFLGKGRDRTILGNRRDGQRKMGSKGGAKSSRGNGNTQRLQTQLIKVNIEAGQGLAEGPRTYLEPPELLISLTQLVRVICRNGSFHGFLM